LQNGRRRHSLAGRDRMTVCRRSGARCWLLPDRKMWLFHRKTPAFLPGGSPVHGLPSFRVPVMDCSTSARRHSAVRSGNFSGHQLSRRPRCIIGRNPPFFWGNQEHTNRVSKAKPGFPCFPIHMVAKKRGPNVLYCKCEYIYVCSFP